jgi:death-on-curing protein
MSEPTWIQENVVLAIYQRQISEHGGRFGLRDKGFLSSALARPQNLFFYSSPKPDEAALAASYAYGIVKNHPFIDGNKRTAYVVCRTFLKLNGRDIEASDLDKYHTFVSLTDGSLSEEHFAEWIRSKLMKS